MKPEWMMAATVGTVLLLASGCSLGPKVDERDGAELAAIMTTAHDALKEGDAVAFKELFAPAGRQSLADRAWQDLQQTARRMGTYKLGLLTQPPDLQRASNGKHVSKLRIKTWFDFSTLQNRETQAFLTAWTFAREEDDTKWWLTDLDVNPAGDYDLVLSDLYIMGDSEVDALAMQWQPGINPAPLIEKVLNALAANDIETLKTCSVNGALFSALDRGIEFPRTANDAGHRSGGDMNRRSSVINMRGQVNNLRDYTRRVGLEIADLLPFFQAYAVTWMPERCTKIELGMQFEGPGCPGKTAGLDISWSAGYFKERWLVGNLWVEAYKVWTLQPDYN